MSQTMFDTRWQGNNPFTRPKQDPLTPDSDHNPQLPDGPRYSYNVPPNPARIQTLPTTTGVPQSSQYQPVKDDTYYYQFQNQQSNMVPSTATSAHSPWDAYLAWDDGESWTPFPDTSVEDYMGGLPAMQTPNFNWDWNNPTFPTPSSTTTFADNASVQQSLANASGPQDPIYGGPQSTGIDSQVDRTMSWSTAPRLSPDSVPSLESSFPSHRTSVDRSPPQFADQPSKLSKGQSSSSSETENHASPPNPRESVAKGGKKRSLPAAEFVKDGPEGAKIAKRSKKVAHNTVEKRYRMNLNSKIAELRESIPSLRSNKDNLSDEDENGENAAPSKGLRKAQVLSKANEYIHELERQARQLRNENEALKKKMALLRTVAASEEPQGASDAHAHRPSTPIGTNQPVQRRSAKGFRPLAMQPAKPPSPTSNRPGKNSGAVNKAVMGCLAGLTVFEGMSDHGQAGQPQSRGLFAVPFELLRHLAHGRPLAHIPGLASMDITFLTILKIALVAFTLVAILSPSLFEQSPRSKKGKKQSVTPLHPAPSLASAIEVRQKAWLTCIQTVWVPRRNLALELAALGLKTTKIFIRSAIGWKGYAAITGFTEADEVARIKAWDIALDSQLTGGDPEICLDRLALTFLASLTLPTAPGRSALKALHIHVLFKSLESKNFVRWFGVQKLATKLATTFWNKARDLNDSAHPDALPSEPMAESEVLPKYVTVLLQRPVEEIFTDEVKQRALNLAHNRSTTQDIAIRDEGSELVVADFAIRAPLDALAAWFSSRMLRKALHQILESPQNHGEIMKHLSLALQSAPPRSAAQLRAIVAAAVYQQDDRPAKVQAAFDMMEIRPVSSPKAKSALSPSSAIAGAKSPDTRIALRCAMIFTGLAAPTWPSSLSPPRLLQSLATILSNPDQDVALLGFVAAYTTLQFLSKQQKLFEPMQEDIEKLSASLRILVGGDAGRSWGLDDEAVRKCVGVCLDVCKRAAGIAEDKSEREFSDQGYGSGLDADSDTKAETEVEESDENGFSDETPAEVEVDAETSTS